MSPAPRKDAPLPSELRHIRFRPVEVVIAVREYRRRMRRPLPSGFLRAFRIASAGPITAIFEISPDGGADRDVVELSEAELAAALIFFCIDRKIPLPAAGSKALARSGDGVTLIVTLNPKIDDEGLPGRI
jgi:hypothetical protein